MKLVDICEINPKAVTLEDNTLVSFVAMPDVSENGKIKVDTFRPYGEVKKGFTCFKEGDVLFAKITPCMENGKGALAIGLKNGFGCGSTEFHVLRPKENMVIGKWLYYLTTWSVFRVDAERHMTGSAGQKRVPKTFLEKYELEVPSLKIQEQQVIQLDRLRKIIDLRKQQLSALDDLIKARFVEMFGDPVQNPKGWDEVNISTVLRGKASNGFFAKREDYLSDGNVSILGVAYIVNRMYSQIDNLPRTNASLDDIQKFSVQYGDMLFCRSSLVAEGIGKASIVPKNTPKNILFECHVIRLPLDLEKCIPEFLQVLSTTDYFRKQMIAQSKTATMTTIGQEGILKATIILPPMDKQKNFYVFVSHINKMKSTIQKALEQSQLLFDSLMQEYFG